MKATVWMTDPTRQYHCSTFRTDVRDSSRHKFMTMVRGLDTCIVFLRVASRDPSRSLWIEVYLIWFVRRLVRGENVRTERFLVRITDKICFKDSSIINTSSSGETVPSLTKVLESTCPQPQSLRDWAKNVDHRENIKFSQPMVLNLHFVV